MKNYFYLIEINAKDEELLLKILTELEQSEADYGLNIPEILKAVEESKKESSGVVVKTKSAYFASKIACTEAILAEVSALQEKMHDWLQLDIPMLSTSNPLLEKDIDLSKIDESTKEFWTLDRLGFCGLYDDANDEYFIRISGYEYADDIKYEFEPGTKSYDVNEAFHSSSIH